MTIVCQLTLHWVFLQLFTIPPIWEAFNAWNEPGRLAALRRAAAGVYSEQRFLIDGWRVHALSAAIPAGGGVAGVRVLHAGVRRYADTRVHVLYGLRMGKAVLASGGLGYGKDGPEAEMGSVWDVGKSCRLGVQLRMGAGGAGYGGISLTYGVGLPVELELAAGKEAGYPLSGRVQLMYRPVERFVLMGGYAAGPLLPYCGVGWAAGWWKMGIIGRWHPYLGVSPGIMIGWNGRDHN